jgi:hypothetical protein
MFVRHDEMLRQKAEERKPKSELEGGLGLGFRPLDVVR